LVLFDLTGRHNKTEMYKLVLTSTTKTHKNLKYTDGIFIIFSFLRIAIKISSNRNLYKLA